MITVFFDSSVLFSGLYSSTGSSRGLIELVKRNIIYGITSETVIDELENNSQKLNYKINIGLLINEYGILIREKISNDEIKLYKSFIEEKDCHVVAGAILTGSQYLVTLDKKHLNNQMIKGKIKDSKIISPGELLKKMLEIME